MKDDLAITADDGSWSFYEAIAAIYDRSGQSRFSLRMTAYLLECLAIHRVAPKRILDLACGTGAASVALAKRRFEVTGVDASEAMLARAQARASRWGVPVVWQRGDMRDLAILGQFDLALCFFDSINHLTDPTAVQAFFHGVRAQLDTGGHFFFDANTPHALTHTWGKAQDCHLGEDYARIWRTSYEHTTGLAHLEATYFIQEEGMGYRRVTVQHRARGYAHAPIAQWLYAAGFDLVTAHPCFTFDPILADTDRIAYWAVAR